MIVFLLLLLGAVMNDTSARDVISFNTGWQFKKGPFSRTLCVLPHNGTASGRK